MCQIEILVKKLRCFVSDIIFFVLLERINFLTFSGGQMEASDQTKKELKKKKKKEGTDSKTRDYY